MVSISKLFLTVVIGFGLCHFSAAEGDAKISAPETEMVDLAAEIGSYVRERKPDFLLIGNGAVGLLEVTEDNAEENVARLIRVLDGFFMESRFYDGRVNGAKARRNNRATDEFLTAMLEKPLRAERQVFTLDYVKGKKIHTVQEMGATAGYVSDGGDTALDVIPDRRPMNENTNDVTQLRQAKNFLVLLNPEHYKTRESYIKALSETNYDLLIVDLCYDGHVLLPVETERLKHKANGGKRLLLSYMSIGEAEHYRPYWKTSWDDVRPHWLAEPNPAWEGNDKVRYWAQEWKEILYGSPDAYLDRIIDAGFDGAFLDVMDAWQYFKEEQ